jgi:PepSY-associated TM region
LSGIRATWHIRASRIHKWLALIIGLQVLIWFSSGAIMSFLPIEKVRGEHLVNRAKAAELPAGLDLSKLQVTGATAIQINMVDGRAVARVEMDGMEPHLFDVATGQPRPQIDAAEAQRIARSAWLGKTDVKMSVSSVTTESPEYRSGLPAWRVSFADPDNTRIFVEASSGRIAAVRTGTWRLYDFVWGLHIMDWSNHENFNTPWLLAFAGGGVLFGLAGSVLLFMRWPRRRKSAGGD